jgi:hypothetical protein
MAYSHHETLQVVLDGLMRRYRERVPAVSHIVSHMVERGMIANANGIINDHIAFRTLGVPQLGIASLEKIFLALGYTKRDPYHFSKKKLNAYWYSPPSDPPNLPRIFISECMVESFSKETQAIIHAHAAHVPSDPVDALDLTNGNAVDAFLHTRLWPQPTWEDYMAVANESEYVAWVLNNQYYLNHFTISIHALPDGVNTIEPFNDFLESIGVQLNDSGGKIKVSRDGKLLQSASVSNMIQVEFLTNEGTPMMQSVPGSYVEFAQRIDGRDGFDSGNADRIFESTYIDQADRTTAKEEKPGCH